MQARPNPLKVIINPSGIQDGMPGDTIELHVVLSNQGNQSAVVYLYFAFDDDFKSLMGWSDSPRESVAIDPQQNSDEITFYFPIPPDALPGTYNYTLVVDSPDHYPQDTPINFPQQIKVISKQHTVIRVNDPTFSLKPGTNVNKPLIYNFTEPLQVEVTVDNRSNRVDRFRLTCPDLDEDWYTISYITTRLDGPGLLADVTALPLNPGAQGLILWKFHPPTDTLAGSYSPTIRLHSENLPDLVLLDLVYIQIPTVYRIDVELTTVLGQVSRIPGKYTLSLFNRGNVVRELNLIAESRDEEQLFSYNFEPGEVRLLPSRSYESNLTIKPRPWWRRPWFGAGLFINFQVKVQDKQSFPLSHTVPEGRLLWKPRPFWQLLLLILLSLGLLGGLAFIIWRMLNPDPLKIENFRANSEQITEGNGEVLLSWDIRNYQQLKQLELRIKGAQPIKPTIYDFKNGIPETLVQPCQIQGKKDLICSNLKPGITAQGTYTFELQGVYRKGVSVFAQTTKTETQNTQVAINEKPIADVVDFKANKSQFTKGDNILFNWKISNPLLLDKIEIASTTEDGVSTGAPVTYKFNQGNIEDPKLQNSCKEENQQLECTNISLPASKPGKFIFEIKAFPNNGSPKISSKKTENKIQVSSKPFKIVAFTINGSDQPTLVLDEGKTARLDWRVEGEDIQVKFDPIIGNVSPVGSKQLPVNLAFPTQIKLQVVDKFGQQPPLEKSFAITVKPKVEPTPTPPINPVPPFNPAPPIPVPNNQSAKPSPTPFF